MEVLDLSNNSIGLPGKYENKCIEALGEFFVSNKKLKHLDLSFNLINYEDSLILAGNLEKNFTIYGFHYTGNHGYVDDRGFLIPE